MKEPQHVILRSNAYSYQPIIPITELYKIRILILKYQITICYQCFNRRKAKGKWMVHQRDFKVKHEHDILFFKLFQTRPLYFKGIFFV